MLEEFGRCDILVNNAGMSPLYAKVTDITEAYYDKVSAVNLKGPFALSLRLGGHMYDHDGGSIVNISTLGSIRPSRTEVVYGMAKSGLNAMTIALADAFGPKVRVNCILPGRHPHRHLQGLERGDDRQRPQDADGSRRLRRGLPGGRAVLRQRGVGVDHRHLPARRRRDGPPAGTVTVAERVPYDEFGLFHENAAEFGLPYDGPPTVRRESVAVDDDRRLSALVWGTGAPELVFLHGGAQNAHTWDTVAMALDRPLVAIDLPGHGHSDGGKQGQLDLADNAADVAVAIRALAPDARAVVGMSLGGLTTIALARHAPDLVRAMVLVDITPGVTAEKAKAITDFVNGPASFPSFDELLAAHDGAQPDPLRVVAAAGDPAQRRAARGRLVGLALRPSPPAGRRTPSNRSDRSRTAPTCGT